MKSAEEWMPAKAVCEVTPEWIREIQIDAMREGMRRAAGLANKQGDNDDEAKYGAAQASYAILFSANSLTEQDLQQ